MNGRSSDAFDDVVHPPEVQTRIFEDDGTFPNNETLPVLVFRHAFRLSGRQTAQTVERVFRAHDWRGTWRNGIFSYHHYHSTAHEVLGVTEGAARVQLGGPDGEAFEIVTGDVLVLPAGVAHKNLGSEGRFQVVGAYAGGRSWDLKSGEAGERSEVKRNIAQVPLPSQDPVYGDEGPLVQSWGET